MLLTALSGASCVAEIGDAEGESPPPTEDITEVTSPVFYAGFWTDDPRFPNPTRANGTLAIARNFDKTYAWYTDGKVCRGSNTVLCADGFWDYAAAANNDFKSIRAIAFEPFANRVYTWYSDARYSVGVPTNLRSVNDKRAFALPPKPGGGTFVMDDLVDAYCSAAPVFLPLYCTYYWENKISATSSTFWRTVGTPSNSYSVSGPKQVTHTTDHGRIVGIDYNYDNSMVYTWYSDGRINQSTSSLNLAQ
jgi:hypothetical protein